jgi:zinc transport system ATP-binding protein
MTGTQPSAESSAACQCSLQIRGLSVQKHDGLILHNIHLDVHHGEIMALIGRNGAGKTTLLKALLGRCDYTGSIVFHNSKGETIPKPRIGYVPQRLDFDRSAPITAADLLCSNLSRRPVWLGHSGSALKRASAMLEKVGGSSSLLSKRLGSLSGGELQRVLLAFALEPMPDLLLLDEPVAAVDRKGIGMFYELVTSLRSEYHMPIILVSHDLSHVQKYATEAAVLDKTILLSGTPREVLRSPQIREIFGLPAKEGGF